MNDLQPARVQARRIHVDAVRFFERLKFRKLNELKYEH